MLDLGGIARGDRLRNLPSCSSPSLLIDAFRFRFPEDIKAQIVVLSVNGGR